MARVNQALIRQIVRDPRGPVGVDLTRRAMRIANTAKVLAPVDRGRLRSSITHTDPRPVAEGLLVQVGTNVLYSRAVHEGSGSPFAPRSWRIGHSRGHVVLPRRFLTNAMPAGMA